MLLKDGEGIVPVKTVINLNQAGLDASKQYDADGYPVEPLIRGSETVRKNGNVIRHSSDAGGSWTLIAEFVFDTTKPNLPNKYPFFGKSDKNLLVRLVQSSPDVDIYKPGELHRVNHYYQFDRYGRVKRLIRVGKDEKKSGWPFVIDAGNIGVFDYEYECP